MKSFIVYGPQGCGKTRNAEALRKALKCRFICDKEDDVYASRIVWPGTHRRPYSRQPQNRQDSRPYIEGLFLAPTLFLTHSKPPQHVIDSGCLNILSFDQAMLRAGLST